METRISAAFLSAEHLSRRCRAWYDGEMEVSETIDVASGGQPHLMEAALAGDAVAVENCLAKGVELEEVDLNGWSALICAASSGSLKCLNLLIEAGARIDVLDIYKRSPLMIAAGCDIGKKDFQGNTAEDLARKSVGLSVKRCHAMLLAERERRLLGGLASGDVEDGVDAGRARLRM